MADGVPASGRHPWGEDWSMESARSRVLIVEDDLATLYALQALFLHRGWNVSLSRTVAGALAQLVPPFDWIILDLELTDGDGEEVLRHMRETGIPSRVVVLSAVQDPERHEDLKPLRPDRVLPKPVRFRQILGAWGGDRPL